MCRCSISSKSDVRNVAAVASSPNEALWNWKGFITISPLQGNYSAAPHNNPKSLRLLYYCSSFFFSLVFLPNMLIVFSYRVIYLFCLYSLWQLKEVDRVTYEEMNNITMKTVSVFYLICVFIVLFASSSDAVRSQPDAELKVVHITLYSYSRKEDGAVSLTFLVWGWSNAEWWRDWQHELDSIFPAWTWPWIWLEGKLQNDIYQQ